MDRQQFLNQDIYQEQNRFATDMHDTTDYPSRLYSVNEQIDYDQMRKVRPWMARYQLWSWDPNRRTYKFKRPPGGDSLGVADVNIPYDFDTDYVYCENSNKMVDNSVSKDIQWSNEPCIYEKRIVTADNRLTPERLYRLKDILSLNYQVDKVDPRDPMNYKVEPFDPLDPVNPFGQRDLLMANNANILFLLVVLALFLYLLHR